MPLHTIIPAAVTNTQPLLSNQNRYPGPSSYAPRQTYGATSSSSPSYQVQGSDEDGMEEDVTGPYGEYADEDGSDDGEPIINVTWRYMSRLYLLVPFVTLIFLGLLIVLVTFAWPPNTRERKAGQLYPHPFLAKPFIIGILASCTIQTLRIPVWVTVSWLHLPQAFHTILSTILHTVLHELLRLSTLTLIVPSPTSGFHSSYYLGLGWGVAETAYGIVQGWEQLVLYEDIMKPDSEDPLEAETNLESGVSNKTISNGREREISDGGLEVVREVPGEVEVDYDQSQVTIQPEPRVEAGYFDTIEEEEDEAEDEADLERKVEFLEKMRGRRELEQLIGLPFPNIPFPLHLLWRLDTLLLNLGLTLLLSAYYFDPSPIYRHSTPPSLGVMNTNGGVMIPNKEPHPYLWLVWGLVVLLHVAVSLVWKVVGRLGIGAVTWGGLIIALGSVFAGLGAWGGLV